MTISSLAKKLIGVNNVVVENLNLEEISGEEQIAQGTVLCVARDCSVFVGQGTVLCLDTPGHRTVPCPWIEWVR